MPNVAQVGHYSAVLRASSATSGTSAQEATVVLPWNPKDLWVHIDKTAEGNSDNLFTVRLQCSLTVGWVDMPYTAIIDTVALTDATANEVAGVTRASNIFDEYTAAAIRSRIAYFDSLASNTIRIIWVASGTDPAITFSASAHYNSI